MDGDRLCNAFWSPESKQTEKVRGTPISLLVSHVCKRKRGNDREMRGGIERERDKEKEKGEGGRESVRRRGRKEREQLGEGGENCTHTQNHYMGISRVYLDCRMEVSFLVHTLLPLNEKL